MIKQLTATALAFLASAAPAFAHHIEHQPFVESETRLLLEAVQSTGHQVLLDHEGFCDKRGLMGAATSRRFLIICVKNHHGDLAELSDTIRHEAVHLIQFCKGRNNGATAAELYPEQRGTSITYSTEVLHFTGEGYNHSNVYREAEARTMAHLLDEDEIARQLISTCSR